MFNKLIEIYYSGKTKKEKFSFWSSQMKGSETFMKFMYFMSML